MSRIKLDKAWIRRQGNYEDGRKRYILEKEINGKIKTIALNPDKLWEILVEKTYDLKKAKSKRDNPSKTYALFY